VVKVAARGAKRDQPPRRARQIGAGSSPRRVALVIETSTTFGRRLLSGIAAYVRENGPWSVYFGERTAHDPVPRWLDAWKGDGIISRVASPEIREVIAGSGIPVVDLNEQMIGLGVPLISNDHAAIARTAAAHLLERGFTHFGYVGHAGLYWSDRRRDEFSRRLEEAGYATQVFCHGVESLRSLRQGAWELELDSIASWLVSLPKPAGIMTCDDFRGVQLLAACRIAGIAVPEQVAVVGVGADEIACELADPPLSSVVLNASRMGYEAARMLDRLMRGEKAEGEVLVPPLEVAARQSTDVMAISDPVVAKAMHFVREHACEGINVEDVLTYMAMSRTALQDRFRKTLRRSIHDVVVEARMSRVKELLVETSLSLEKIAERTGFAYPEYMSIIFRQRTGWTPARYRREHCALVPQRQRRIP
jgi:LacI family transcriptional regulator